MGFQPVRSRLRPPRAHLELVRRDELVDSLLRLDAPVVLMSAPAGYGKTTALAQWVAAERRPTAWVQLAPADNDPVVLLTYLVAALEEIAPLGPAVVGLLQDQHPPMAERILPALAEALTAAPPFLLVLDDGHLLRNDACWRQVDFVVDQLPDGAQVAIGTRRDPALPLARLRAAGRLAELRTESLAMSRHEAQELLDLHGFTCNDETLDAVLAVTEGWPTGLYLALLAGEGRDASAWLPRVRGDRREIAAYLGAEVLERQPDEVQRFLTRTSLLDSLSAPLCEAVAGGGGAARVLARLARENLFVAALDDHNECYRYHHLFRELLRAQLERREPDGLSGLHRKAATWCHAHGDVEEATRHWLAASDVAAAATPVAARCDWLLLHGKFESARLLLDQFTEAQLLSQACLTLTAAMVYGSSLADPRRERWCRAACTIVADDSPSPVGTASMRSWQLMIRANSAPDGIGRMLEDAEAACRLEETGAADWLAYATKMLAMATYLAGRPRRAEHLLLHALRQAEDANDAEDQAWALASLFLVAADQGRWDEAGAYDARLTGLTTHVVQMPTPFAHLRLLARRDDPALPVELERAARLLDDLPFPGAHKTLLGAVIVGEIHLERDDMDQAERWATRAEGVLREYPDAGMLRGRTERLRQAIERRRLTDPLTAAERRVLDLLPTQLTADQMAARLFVSRNTVKTHLRRLYAKLGVTSRTAAVERARTLRLLSPTSEPSAGRRQEITPSV